MAASVKPLNSVRALGCALLATALLTGLLGPAPAADASFVGSLDAAEHGQDLQSFGAEAVASARFVDVAEAAFFFDAVAWARIASVTTGTSATTFSPSQPVPRWQMALFLRRFAAWLDAETPTEPHGFDDVGHLSDEAQDAIGWLKSTGITTGTAPTTYGPDQPVTRAQMGAFLRRFADWAGLAQSTGPDSFVDTQSESAEFRRAIGWLQTTKITTGTSPTTFDPSGSVSRGQMVTFLHRLAQTTHLAAIASLLISPRDVDTTVRCYNDAVLESDRPVPFVYPLEVATEEAYEEVRFRQSDVAIARGIVSDARDDAAPTFELGVSFVVDDRLDLLAGYVAILVANQLLQETEKTFREKQIESMEEHLNDPGLTFGNMFTAAGEDQWVGYLDDRYWDGGEGLAETASEIALSGPVAAGPQGLAAGEVAALAEEIVSNTVLEALVGRALPRARAALAVLQAEIDETVSQFDQATAEIAQLVLDGVSITFFTPPSEASLLALEDAEKALDAAEAALDEAEAVYEAAALAEINPTTRVPSCDSPELIVGFVEIICATPFPDLDPEPFPGYSQFIRDGIARMCSVVYQIDDTYAELVVV
ncbi:MAG: hypothetical protein ACI9C1_000790 [Candidatus Aldehydirespiratoraceae bacterium]|jgi:hypothetical protein